MKKINLCLGLLTLVLLVACNGKSKKSGLNMNGFRGISPLSVEQGKSYSSECVRDSEGAHYTIGLKIFEENEQTRINTDLHFYAKAGCQNEMFKLRSTADGEISEAGRLLSLQYTSGEMTVLSNIVTDAFNEKGVCGIYDWQTGMAQDLMNTDCRPTSEEYLYLNATENGSGLTIYICQTRELNSKCQKVNLQD